jgi:chromosome partitioning protein
MAKTNIISVLNHKGGVGKTTSVVNIGAALHRLGKRILLIDLDPQANLTYHLFNQPVGEITIYQALLGDISLPITEIKPGFDLVVSTLDLSGVEIDLHNEPGREYILRELIAPFVKDYDYILIDCPPSLGLLTIMALSTSTRTIIPVEAGTFAMVGMTKLFEIIDKVKHRINKNLDSYSILITKYDGRKTIQKEIAERIQQLHSASVFHSFIRSNVALEEATMEARSVFDSNPKSAGAEDYLSVANEIIKNDSMIA